MSEHHNPLIHSEIEFGICLQVSTQSIVRFRNTLICGFFIVVVSITAQIIAPWIYDLLYVMSVSHWRCSRWDCLH